MNEIMELVFGTFNYVEFEVYKGLMYVRYKKPSVDGKYKISIIDRVVWVFEKIQGNWVPCEAASKYAIHECQDED